MAKTSSGAMNRLSFGGGRFIYNGRSWPLRGAHATVSDKRCGLARRKHVITLAITSGDYPVMTWRAQRIGAAATGLYQPWSAFAANLNQAAAAEDRSVTVTLPTSDGNSAGQRIAA